MRRAQPAASAAAAVDEQRRGPVRVDLASESCLDLPEAPKSGPADDDREPTAACLSERAPAQSPVLRTLERTMLEAGVAARIGGEDGIGDDRCVLEIEAAVAFVEDVDDPASRAAAAAAAVGALASELGEVSAATLRAAEKCSRTRCLRQPRA